MFLKQLVDGSLKRFNVFLEHLGVALGRLYTCENVFITIVHNTALYDG